MLHHINSKKVLKLRNPFVLHQERGGNRNEPKPMREKFSCQAELRLSLLCSNDKNFSHKLQTPFLSPETIIFFHTSPLLAAINEHHLTHEAPGTAAGQFVVYNTICFQTA